MHRLSAGLVVLLSLLTGCEAQSKRTVSADFEIRSRAVVTDDRISVWEVEVEAEQDCRLIVKEGSGGTSTVWLRSSQKANASGRIVIAASLVPGEESQKGTLTFLARVHMSGGHAGGPSVYHVDAEDLESVVAVDLQGQEGVFGTPIQFGKVDGQNLTLIVEKQ